MNHLTDIDFLAFIGKQESQYLTTLENPDVASGIRDRFEFGVKQYGATTPWHWTKDKLRFRPSEVTVWAGSSGHGKSLITSQIVADLMQQRCRCLIASLEMPLPATGYRLLRQMIGRSKPTEEEIRSRIAWTADKLWVYDQLDTVAAERILGMTIYAMTELKIQHVVIDSLMKCGIRGEDYDSQAAFVDRLCWAAKTYCGHIHLVHHLRKGENEMKEPDKSDIKGTGGIADLVDNVCLCWRNKKKEDQLALGEYVDPDVADAMVLVRKQRHGEWEGKIRLWFHPESHQFLGALDEGPKVYGNREGVA